MRPVLCLILNMPLLQQHFENRYNKMRNINNSALLRLALLSAKVIKHWLPLQSCQPAPNSEFVNIIQAWPNHAKSLTLSVMDNVGQMVPVITKIITFSIQEYLLQSPAGRQRGISALFFAQEEKYAALISAQSSEP